ncbi:MAG: hypothetical protein WDN09_03340 [bacterium]
MTVKIKVLLHMCSNIIQNPEAIASLSDFFGPLKLSAPTGIYREIEEYSANACVESPKDFLGMIAAIPLQKIADRMTAYFGCDKVFVDPPKILSSGIMVTYNRGESERNMLFLKILIEEPL